MIVEQEIAKKEKVHKQAGHIVAVTGTVVDVQFPKDLAPQINNLLYISMHTGHKVALEVEQQLGDGIVRCIAIESIEGIFRGLVVNDTGGPIKVPVGANILGRIFNTLGEVIDGQKPVKHD